MRNIIVVTGAVLIILNTIIPFVLQDYATHKVVFGDISIALSTVLLFVTYTMKSADGYKIGYTLFFFLTGIIRFICAILSTNKIKDNYAFLIFIAVLSIEIVMVYVVHRMREK